MRTVWLVLLMALTPLAWGPVADAAPGGGSERPGSERPGARWCAGERATIVGKNSGNGVLEGTAGRDVIVTDGARITRGRGGNDLICVAGGRWSERQVAGGAGNDRILVNQKRAHLRIWPGPGNDVVRGGAGPERILQWGPKLGRDVLRLGAGNDVVDYRTSARSRDAIDMGPGADQAFCTLKCPFPATGARFAGGAGRDYVSLEDSTAALSRVRFDMAAGTVTSNLGKIQVSGIEDTSFQSQSDEVVGTYRGTEGDDRFAYLSGDFPSVVLGEGDDQVFPPVGNKPGDTLDGGPGSDLLRLQAYGAITADLPSGTASRDAGPDRSEWFFGGFENIEALGSTSATITGTAGPNVIYVGGCSVEVNAGGGDDIVSFKEYRDAGGSMGGVSCDNRPSGWELNGEDGDDLLVSWYLDDVLVGGPGTDSADGRGGADTCDAETEVACES
ncbi:calcium-binding protein [Nocardioides sp. cx-169]|uniref:calcium-binding protein n=1 Tax=Nocardioides sp. cx-169 TaxID=2899080 RepID=UPI001E3FD1F1|nr:calcium-binding protein [Nocardioides sp. cx-169]MCD4532984.1 calcium-binding protein [Nocardioides sp. cx-169]